jgi:hypothetical protein
MPGQTTADPPPATNAPMLPGAVPLPTFDPAQRSFKEWRLQFSNHLSLFGIAEPVQKVRWLIASVTPGVLSNLVSLSDKATLEEETVEDLLKKLADHYEPPKIILRERARLMACVQKVGQTTEDYAVELRKIARDGDFKTFLDDILVLRFSTGILSDKHRRKLFEAYKKTLTECVAAVRLQEEQDKASSTGSHAKSSQDLATMADISAVRQPFRRTNGTRGRRPPPQGSDAVTPNQQTSCTSCKPQGCLLGEGQDLQPLRQTRTFQTGLPLATCSGTDNGKRQRWR